MTLLLQPLLEKSTNNIWLFQELDKNLCDSEGFPRADIDFGELQTYKNLKRT